MTGVCARITGPNWTIQHARGSDSGGYNCGIRHLRSREVLWLIELEPVFRARHGFTHGPQKKKIEDTTFGPEPNSSFCKKEGRERGVLGYLWRLQTWSKV